MTKSRGIGKGRGVRTPRPQKTDEEREGYIIQKRENNLRWSKEYKIQNPKKRLLWSSRKRAKEKGIPHTIVEDDIQIPTHCPYLNVELVPHVPRGAPRIQCISLDRIIPELGYVPGNIEVMSHLANTMKNCASKEQLILFAKAILRKHDSQL